MFPRSNLISCNFSPFCLKTAKAETSLKTHHCHSRFFPPVARTTLKLPHFVKPNSNYKTIFNKKSFFLQTCYSILSPEDDPVVDKDGGVKEGRDWTTSFLLFVLWGGLMYYVFVFAPNQTPSRDMYFLKKLSNLVGDDGFRMNQVLVSLWYIMGLWPLVYSMLLLPTGRSSKGGVPVWPFLILSCFGGAYVLLPYFVLWKPPPTPVDEDELKKWPLNFLESKLTAGVSLAVGTGLIVAAGLATAADWKEFFQYFRESKLVHATCIDFTLLSAFASFWVYNDMTARKWSEKGSWLLLLSLVPFIGPALYLALRPKLSEMAVTVSTTSSDQE
ncbi:hypothetical protein Tsubulata_028889 [Turnera subulata]|uniref:Cardiolipin synthase N-terminal domain-containing protein n=1 Tax=Turnera subulata TaxID=218843 RepID=A0A9Q0FBB9_9ROSI|nr:hypothetical protein Tsubulata_028889 [Turnera subulata]